MPNPPLLPEEQQRAQEETKREHARQLESLDRQLQAEPKDRAWSGEIKTSVDSVVAQPELAGSSVKALECGTTICRMEVTHADVGSQQKFWGLFPNKVPAFGSGTFSQSENADGTIATVAYFTRATEAL